MQGKTTFCLTVFLLLASQSLTPSGKAADTYDLRPEFDRASAARVECLLEVAGILQVPDGEKKTKELQMQAKGASSYTEQILAAEKTPSSGRRAIRQYSRGSAKLAVAGETHERQLAESHRLIVADRGDKKLSLFCPESHLTREELDLISVPGDSLLVDCLLPERPVAIGDQWEHARDVIATLVGIDVANSSDVSSELKEVEGKSARCELKGKLAGAIGGVGTQIEVKAKYTVDLQAKRITWLALLLKENRAIGSAAPGVEATSRLQLKIEPIATVPALAKWGSGKAAEPTPFALLLTYASVAGNFGFDYDRRWQLTTDNDKGAVLRLVDQGELVAQLNVLPMTKPESSELISLSKFQTDIEKALGSNFGQFVVASQNTDKAGRTVYRVVATGKSEELPVQWNYYLVAKSASEQALLIFTLDAGLVERFGDSDRPLIDRVRFSSAVPKTAARPVKSR